ncbi:MAG: isocitrate lyase/PEP mutase family protein [Burkholderiales bacterium]|nr:isocitrate lyase/PEP mutase family protein [Burkholderiales bacterium]
MNAFSRAEALRSLLSEPGIVPMPCCFDALSARLIERAGFRLSMMSGFAVSATRLALPDTGLISFTEMVDSLRNICIAAPSLLVIGDGDTGYGNALNVKRTVTEYARAGAAGIMLEDQVSPKRCGHTRGKQVVAFEEARMKLRAAVDARRSHDIVIMARTDARAVLGFDEALARCRMFVDEGADIVFMEAPEKVSEMRRFCAEIARPCMANMVGGGVTPMLPLAELERLGFRIAAYPLELLTAGIHAMQGVLAALKSGSPDLPARVSFGELKELVGFDTYYSEEERYRA